jgi:hypothetical protein
MPHRLFEMHGTRVISRASHSSTPSSRAGISRGRRSRRNSRSRAFGLAAARNPARRSTLIGS